MNAAENGIVIDAHQHFWNPVGGDYPWMTGLYAPIKRPFWPYDLRPSLYRNEVAGTVVVQARADSVETEELLKLAVEVDFVYGVVGWVDLTSDDVADKLAWLQGLPGGQYLVGVRHNVGDEADPNYLVRPDVLRGLAAVADAGLTFDLEINPAQFSAAAAVAAARPDLRLVLDHLGKPAIAAGRDATWEAGMRQLAEHSNVWAKASGLVTEAGWGSWTPASLKPFVHHALDTFTDHRLVYGSDWPVCLLAATYDQVMGALRDITSELDASARARIFGDNACDAYGRPWRAGPTRTLSAKNPGERSR